MQEAVGRSVHSFDLARPTQGVAARCPTPRSHLVPHRISYRNAPWAKDGQLLSVGRKTVRQKLCPGGREAPCVHRDRSDRPA